MAVLAPARGPTWLILAAALPFILMLAIRPVRSAPVYEDDQQHHLEPIEDSGCYYNYQHYGEGDRIITNEPCLNCTCHNRMLMCYLRVCPFTKAIGQDCTVEKRADQCCPIITCPEVPVQLLAHPAPSTTARPQTPSSSTQVGHPDTYGCTIDSEFYTDGAQIPSEHNKPCELCYCIRNHTACVMQECTLNVEGCRPVYEDNVCCPVRYECDYPDDTTTTESGYGGGLILTTTTTMSPNLGCRFNGEEYADGALIPIENKPCEHCYCMRGEPVCAVQECGKPLEKEGHNCTAMPAQPGKCCPEMYQCDTGIEYVTDTSFRMHRKHYGNTSYDSLSDSSDAGSISDTTVPSLEVSSKKPQIDSEEINSKPDAESPQQDSDGSDKLNEVNEIVDDPIASTPELDTTEDTPVSNPEYAGVALDAGDEDQGSDNAEPNENITQMETDSPATETTFIEPEIAIISEKPLENTQPPQSIVTETTHDIAVETPVEDHDNKEQEQISSDDSHLSETEDESTDEHKPISDLENNAETNLQQADNVEESIQEMDENIEIEAQNDEFMNNGKPEVDNLLTEEKPEHHEKPDNIEHGTEKIPEKAEDATEVNKDEEPLQVQEVVSETIPEYDENEHDVKPDAQEHLNEEPADISANLPDEDVISTAQTPILDKPSDEHDDEESEHSPEIKPAGAEVMKPVQEIIEPKPENMEQTTIEVTEMEDITDKVPVDSESVNPNSPNDLQEQTEEAIYADVNTSDDKVEIYVTESAVLNHSQEDEHKPENDEETHIQETQENLTEHIEESPLHQTEDPETIEHASMNTTPFMDENADEKPETEDTIANINVPADAQDFSTEIPVTNEPIKEITVSDTDDLTQPINLAEESSELPQDGNHENHTPIKDQELTSNTEITTIKPSSETHDIAADEMKPDVEDAEGGITETISTPAQEISGLTEMHSQEKPTYIPQQDDKGEDSNDFANGTDLPNGATLTPVDVEGTVNNIENTVNTDTPSNAQENIDENTSIESGSTSQERDPASTTKPESSMDINTNPPTIDTEQQHFGQDVNLPQHDTEHEGINVNSEPTDHQLDINGVIEETTLDANVVNVEQQPDTISSEKPETEAESTTYESVNLDDETTAVSNEKNEEGGDPGSNIEQTVSLHPITATDNQNDLELSLIEEHNEPSADKDDQNTNMQPQGETEIEITKDPQNEHSENEIPSMETDNMSIVEHMTPPSLPVESDSLMHEFENTPLDQTPLKPGESTQTPDDASVQHDLIEEDENAETEHLPVEPVESEFEVQPSLPVESNSSLHEDENKPQDEASVKPGEGNTETTDDASVQHDLIEEDENEETEHLPIAPVESELEVIKENDNIGSGVVLDAGENIDALSSSDKNELTSTTDETLVNEAPVQELSTEKDFTSGDAEISTTVSIPADSDDHPIEIPVNDEKPVWTDADIDAPVEMEVIDHHEAGSISQTPNEMQINATEPPETHLPTENSSSFTENQPSSSDEPTTSNSSYEGTVTESGQAAHTTEHTDDSNAKLPTSDNTTAYPSATEDLPVDESSSTDKTELEDTTSHDIIDDSTDATAGTELPVHIPTLVELEGHIPAITDIHLPESHPAMQDAEEAEHFNDNDHEINNKPDINDEPTYFKPDIIPGGSVQDTTDVAPLDIVAAETEKLNADSDSTNKPSVESITEANVQDGDKETDEAEGNAVQPVSFATEAQPIAEIVTPEIIATEPEDVTQSNDLEESKYTDKPSTESESINFADSPMEEEKHPEGKPEGDMSEGSSEEVTEVGDIVTTTYPFVTDMSSTSHLDSAPGEGHCIVDGQTYSSGSTIPVANQCQERCICLNFIVHCTLRACPPPPSSNPNCMPMYQDGSCCPIYTCVDEQGQVINSEISVTPPNDTEENESMSTTDVVTDSADNFVSDIATVITNNDTEEQNETNEMQSTVTSILPNEETAEENDDNEQKPSDHDTTTDGNHTGEEISNDKEQGFNTDPEEQNIDLNNNIATTNVPTEISDETKPSHDNEISQEHIKPSPIDMTNQIPVVAPEQHDSFNDDASHDLGTTETTITEFETEQTVNNEEPSENVAPEQPTSAVTSAPADTVLELETDEPIHSTDTNYDQTTNLSTDESNDKTDKLPEISSIIDKPANGSDASQGSNNEASIDNDFNSNDDIKPVFDTQTEAISTSGQNTLSDLPHAGDTEANVSLAVTETTIGEENGSGQVGITSMPQELEIADQHLEVDTTKPATSIGNEEVTEVGDVQNNNLPVEESHTVQNPVVSDLVAPEIPDIIQTPVTADETPDKEQQSPEVHEEQNDEVIDGNPLVDISSNEKEEDADNASTTESVVPETDNTLTEGEPIIHEMINNVMPIPSNNTENESSLDIDTPVTVQPLPSLPSGEQSTVDQSSNEGVVQDEDKPVDQTVETTTMQDYSNTNDDVNPEVQDTVTDANEAHTDPIQHEPSLVEIEDTTSHVENQTDVSDAMPNLEITESSIINEDKNQINDDQQVTEADSGTLEQEHNTEVVSDDADTIMQVPELIETIEDESSLTTTEINSGQEAMVPVEHVTDLHMDHKPVKPIDQNLNTNMDEATKIPLFEHNEETSTEALNLEAMKPVTEEHPEIEHGTLGPVNNAPGIDDESTNDQDEKPTHVTVEPGVALHAEEEPETISTDEHTSLDEVKPVEHTGDFPEKPVQPDVVKQPEVRPQYPDSVLPDLDEDDDGIFPGYPEQVPDPGSEFMPPMPSYEDDDQQASFGPGTCRYGGKVYVSAQQIPRDDPCDFCFCFRSDIICLQQSCPPPIKGCHEEGIDGFCCPRYECPVPMGLMNSTTTTTTTTLPPDLISSYVYGRQAATGCLVQGSMYRVGEEISTASGPCLECRCGGDSKMKCEPKACSPQPMLRKMIEAVSLRR